MVVLMGIKSWLGRRGHEARQDLSRNVERGREVIREEREQRKIHGMEDRELKKELEDIRREARSEAMRTAVRRHAGIQAQREAREYVERQSRPRFGISGIRSTLAEVGNRADRMTAAGATYNPFASSPQKNRKMSPLISTGGWGGPQSKKMPPLISMGGWGGPPTHRIKRKKTKTILIRV